MNNLFIVALAGALGFALFCKTQTAIAAIADDTARTGAQLKALAGEAAKAQGEARRLEKLFITQKESIQTLRADFNVLSAREGAKVEDSSELNPQKEGFWPADKPYFYISKERLRGLSYWPFNDGDGSLSKQAVMLFAMTPQEESAANAAYSQARGKIHTLDKSAAVATNTPARLESRPGTKTTYIIPAFPRDAADAINQEFKSALNAALGPERGSLLSKRIDEVFEAGPYALTQTRTLTLIRNGDKIQLVEMDPEGNTTSSSTTDEEGNQVIPHHVRHLFEE
jgi:hypothetical protein